MLPQKSLIEIGTLEQFRGYAAQRHSASPYTYNFLRSERGPLIGPVPRAFPAQPLYLLHQESPENRSLKPDIL